MNEIILQNKDGQILVSSRDVAEKFGKQHSSVLKTIYGENRKGNHVEGLSDEILASGNPLTKYFIESSYVNRGKDYKECLMTRDGFSLVVMGFTGKEATEWKLKYINAFNKMEEELKKQSVRALPTTYKEALLQLLEEVEKNEKLEEERKVLLPKADYHDEVLNKDGLITTTVVAKDLGFRSAAKLNQIMFLNNIIFKNKSGTWCPYADYEWLITEKYTDYQSYSVEKSVPCLKWTEKGRKWIIENYDTWVKNLGE
jgi:Rha family phage regulatory protein